MNKKIFLKMFGAVAFVVAVMFNFSAGLGNSAQMDIILANVEALAQKEDGIDCDRGNCYGGICHEMTGYTECPCRANGKPSDTCHGK